MDKALRELRERIIASPDDVALRRVYADRLSERGDPRGLFIQVQCELADSWLAAERRAELEALERTLLDRHVGGWIRPALIRGRGDVSFVRGFLEHWRCDATVYIARGNRVSRSTPLRSLLVRNCGLTQLRHLLTLTSFQQIETLGLRGLHAWPFEQLIAHGRFTKLQRLSIQGDAFANGGAARGIRQFGDCDWAARLVDLELDLPIAQTDADALVTATFFPTLLRLKLAGEVCPLGSCPELQELDVSVGADASRLTALLRRATKLRSLCLRFNAVRSSATSDHQVVHTVFDALPASTTSLQLWHAQLDEGAVEAAIASQLRELTLTACKLTAPHVHRLKERFPGFIYSYPETRSFVDRALVWLGLAR